MDSGKVTIKKAEYARLKRDSERLKQVLTSNPVKADVETREVKKAPKKKAPKQEEPTIYSENKPKTEE